jgi:cyclopropane fatty-acyl-phospholipid synthase-like methyltransferase
MQHAACSCKTGLPPKQSARILDVLLTIQIHLSLTLLSIAENLQKGKEKHSAQQSEEGLYRYSYAFTTVELTYF